MLSLVNHAGHEGGDIAEKKCITNAGYDFFFFAMIATFISRVDRRRNQFIVYMYILLFSN